MRTFLTHLISSLKAAWYEDYREESFISLAEITEVVKKKKWHGTGGCLGGFLFGHGLVDQAAAEIKSTYRPVVIGYSVPLTQ